MELINNPMTEEEKVAFFKRFDEACERGMSEEERNNLIKMYPVNPALAKAIKDVFGMSTLKEYNLGNAMKVYGEDYFRS